MGLDGRVVVVTGAARGYGRALVEGLARDGARVVALDISWADDDFTRDLRARPDVLVHAVDITDDTQVEDAYRATLDRFGTVDALVNNAALLQRVVFSASQVSILDSDLAIWERMLAVNFMGPVKMTRAFIRPMVERRGGSIIMISSGSALRGRPGDQPYGATKAALTNLTSSLVEEVRGLNIAVNAVIPATAVTTGYQPPSTPRTGPPAVLPAAGNWMVWKPEAMVPVVCHFAQQDASTETGSLVKVVEWNVAHGFGGDEIWAAREAEIPTAPQH